MSTLIFAMAQINPLVGDIEGNTSLIIEHAQKSKQDFNADVVVFPELTLTGYPPEDLLLRPSMAIRVERALARLVDERLPCLIIIGYPKTKDDKLYNVAGVIGEGKLQYEYAKQCLPNYQVFDEKRYFTEGETVGVYQHAGIRMGLSICEDIWDGAPVAQAKDYGVDILVNLNASPFHQDKQREREALVSRRAKSLGVPLLYVNQVGGQDELVFDGGSVAVDKTGELVTRARFFQETLTAVQLTSSDGRLSAIQSDIAELPDPLVIIYQALVMGVKDYVNKNKFKGIVLGLSGGIDSALTLAIAVDALGADRVEAVMMPFTYTSQMSRDDAAEEAEALGVKYRSIGIEPMYNAFMASLNDVFGERGADKTEENLQARSRGVLLMAISNKLGYLVLTTGNKSEMAVGYATLYGDMAGGLDVLKDVPKTMVFALAKYRNTLGKVIPESVITRPPSAELAPDQKDEDSLPAYEVLDAILERYIEKDQSAETIIKAGYEREDVNRVIRLVDLNEYKRRQAPIGIRISKRAFGRDRRYPITNGWVIGD